MMYSGSIKKHLFISDTPFQTLNMINVAWHEKEKGTGDIFDLCIINQFNAGEYMYEKIREAGLFDHVILVKKEDRQSIQTQMLRHLLVAKDYVFGKSFLKRHIRKEDRSLVLAGGYNYVYSSVMSHIAVALLKRNPGCNFILVDDGTGSYSGDIGKKGVNHKYHSLASLFSGGKAFTNPSKLMLNYPEFFYGSRENLKIEALPEYEDCFLQFLYSCFDLQRDTNTDRKLVFLTQPYTPADLNRQANLQVLDCIYPYRDSVIVRTHPRDPDLDIYGSFFLEQPVDLWELRITQFPDIGEKVLLSFYSTAQLTPKFLYDYEPYLIFAYRLNSGISEASANGIHNMVEKIRSLYRQPEKIFEPKTKDELESLLKRLM